MIKVKTLLIGVMAFCFIIGMNGNVCYAATNRVTCTVTSSKITGKYEYYEKGHQIMVEIYYVEKSLYSPKCLYQHETDVQNGTTNVATVVKKKTDGFKITEGNAFGYVDGKLVGSTGTVYAD